MMSQSEKIEIKAPHGTDLSCKGWIQEAAMRMLMNNLDPEVAENPAELIVYGGKGKAARNWDEFRRLEALGLTMYGQMTAGSWIYIGTEGILQGTYETFAECARKYFDGTLNGKFLLTAGLGGMGGAQPLAATMNGAAFLGVDVDRSHLEKRIKTGYLDVMTDNLDDALKLVLDAKKNKTPLSVGLLGNAGDVLPEILKRNIVPDVLTDQTSAHDTLNGYVPMGMTFEQAKELRKTNPTEYIRLSKKTIVKHVEAMLEFQRRGSITFDYGNNIRGEAKENGVKK